MTSQADQLLELLFDDPATGVLLVDESGWVRRGNQTMARMADLPLDQIEGWPAFMMVGQPDRARFKALVGDGDKADAGAPFTPRVGGTGLRVSIRVNTIIGAKGPGSTRLVRLREAPVLDPTAAAFDHQKLRTLGHFTAGVVHDFNNLLGAMLAAADTLAERARDRRDDHDARILAELRAGTARGRALVGRLLGYGRPMEPAIGDLPVDAAIADLADMLRRLFPASIELVLALESGAERVHADPTRFDQVLVNLAVNARDAMPDGGSLTIRSWSRVIDRGFDGVLGHVPAGSYIVIEVTDSGTGIPPHILPLVFSPFFTTRRERGGHGLGLSTVREIVGEFGGYLTVRSKQGRGTSFRIYLPRVEAMADARQRPASGSGRAKPSAGRGTVLLVDDEAALRKLAEAALLRAGWQVLAADTAEAALAMIGELGPGGRRPSILVTDIGLPGMNGWLLAEALRVMLDAPELPVVLTSGTSRQVGAVTARLGSAAVFLAKPFEMTELSAAMERFAHGPGPIDVSRASNVSGPLGNSGLDEHITNKTLRHGLGSAAPEGLDVTDSAELG